jgi:signal peptidase II
MWIIPGYLAWTSLRNQGMAFGLGAGAPAVVTGIQAALLGLIGLVGRRCLEGFLTRDVALGLVTAGLAGNLIDRLFRGAVVDFVDLRVWPVFNLADALVVAGLLVLVWGRLRRRQER